MNISLEKIIKYILVAILFIPLIFTPFTLYPSYFGKTAIFQILIELALLIYAVIVLKQKKINFKYDALFLIFLIYLAIRIITGFLGLNSEKSFWGNAGRMGGNFTWLHYLVFYFLLLQFIKERACWFKLFKIACIAGFLAALTGILQRFGITPETWWPASRRIYGIIGNSIPFAGYILFSLFLSASVFYQSTTELFKKWREITGYKNRFKAVIPVIFWLIVLVTLVIALFWSGTRGAIYVFLASLPLLFCAFLLFSRKKILKISAVLILVVLAVFGFYFGLNGNAAKILETNTLKTRILNWEVAIKGWTDNTKTFLLGSGAENYDRVFDKFYNSEFLKYSFYETVGDKPHNILLEVVNASGVFGLISYLAIFLAAIILLFKNNFSAGQKIFLFFGLTTYLGQNLFEFDTTNTLIPFILVLAFISSGALKEKTMAMPKIFSYLIITLIALCLWFGNIKPVIASCYAIKSNDYVYADQDLWGIYAKKALNFSNIYDDETRTLIANDLFNLNGQNRFNSSNANIEALLLMHDKLKESDKKHPGTFAYKHRLAQVEGMMGEYVDKKYFDDAEQTFYELDLQNPARQAVGMAWGQMKLLKGEKEEGIKFWEGIVLRNPDTNIPHWYLGLALLIGGNKERGAEELEKAIKLGYPFNDGAEADIIVGLWEEKGEYNKIASFYENLILKEYNKMQATGEGGELLKIWWMRLAATYAKLGKTEDAILAAEKVIQIDPSLTEEARSFIESLKK